MTLSHLKHFVLGKLEADDAPLPLVYDYFGKLRQFFEHDDDIKKIVVDRLKFIYTDSIGLAYYSPQNGPLEDLVTIAKRLCATQNYGRRELILRVLTKFAGR